MEKLHEAKKQKLQNVSDEDIEDSNEEWKPIEV